MHLSKLRNEQVPPRASESKNDPRLKMSVAMRASDRVFVLEADSAYRCARRRMLSVYRSIRKQYGICAALSRHVCRVQTGVVRGI